MEDKLSTVLKVIKEFFKVEKSHRGPEMIR